MKQRFPQDHPSWYHAVSLRERSALRAGQRQTENMAVNLDLAKRRIGRWRSEQPFSTESYFAERLALEGLSEDEFLSLLGEPIEAVRNRLPSPPTWLLDLILAFSRPASYNPIPLPESLRGQETAGFLDAVEALSSQGRERLRQGVRVLISELTELPFDSGTIEDILAVSLPGWLMKMLSPSMVLELNVARLQNGLHGETSQERFHSFLEKIRQRDTALAFLQEYPVLARQLVICIDQWASSSLEFLERLCADWQAICTLFSPGNNPGVLVELDSDVGDRHRNGRSVLIAKFGSGCKVVYKPRPLALDLHFQELLTWVNERGVHAPFNIMKILDCGSHGWVEFIDAQSCISTAEVQRFYERQGGYLALLYALEAVDFHCENLIAAGEHPMLLDLEGLFHPRIGGIHPQDAAQLAEHTFSYSVMRAGLLPTRLGVDADSEVEFSGLGAVPGQLSPFGVPQWEQEGTDEMHLTRKQMAMRGGWNRPRLNGSEVDLLDYPEEITAGFTRVYRLLLKHREDLLSERSPVMRLAKDEVRVILRETMTYGALLRESFHPDVLRDALDRDRLFDRLWARVEHLPHLAKVISAEQEDLLRGDIPIFATRPDSRSLWTSSHQEVADFFDQPSLVLVQDRLQQLGDDDLAKQLWFIRAALATLPVGDDSSRRLPVYSLNEPQTRADAERLLAAARSVGDRLEAIALASKNDVSWIGMNFTREGRWCLAPLGMDLYVGLPGVTLFLAYLGAMTGEERYTLLARAAFERLQSEVEKTGSDLTAIGSFYGWGGLIYTLTHLSTLWEEPGLLGQADRIVELLPTLIDQDEELDINSGAAGCIYSLMSLYACLPTGRTLAAMIQCGDRLLSQSRPMGPGIGWTSTFLRTKCGFAHGAAGMASALLELAALTGQERFHTAALSAMNYERSLLSPQAGNWPILRMDSDKEDAFMVAWCHGAPGIGLSRLRALRHVDDPAIRGDIDVALRTTLCQGFGHNHSLCHGDLGNLEFLLQASRVLNDPQLRAQVNRLTAIILESIDRHGWLCAIPFGVISPGLMNGLAGIGYELLRLSKPECVPSVLILEPPTIRRVAAEKPAPRSGGS